jgi:hypothetical protein
MSELIADRGLRCALAERNFPLRAAVARLR